MKMVQRLMLHHKCICEQITVYFLRLITNILFAMGIYKKGVILKPCCYEFIHFLETSNNHSLTTFHLIIFTVCNGDSRIYKLKTRNNSKLAVLMG
jgi:hypothetical protein